MYVCKLRPVDYRWKSGEDWRKHWGLIAQDLQAALQEDVATVQEPGLPLCCTVLVARVPPAAAAAAAAWWHPPRCCAA